MSLHSNVQHSNFRAHPLTDEEIQRFAPSVFAAEAHQSRSERYKYIPTARVLEGMRKAGFIPFSAKQARTRDESRREFTKHMIRFRREDVAVSGVGDLVPEVVLVNAHDGSSSYKLMAGIFRVICMNGLIVKSSDFDSLTVGHSGNIEEKVIEGSYRVIESSVRALEAPKQWSQIALNPREQMALANAAYVLRFADAEGNVATPIKPEQLLLTHRTADQKSDLWTTFNVVQENVIRGGLHGRTQPSQQHRRGRAVTTREVRGIDQDVKLNRALWVLGEEMAKAKAA